jgi:AcrR family transcriptional regulator
MARSIDPYRRDAILDAAHAVFARKGYAEPGDAARLGLATPAQAVARFTEVHARLAT